MCHLVILFICSRESDYLQDLTYAGLSELLGRGQIADFPFHWQFHRRKESFWSRKAAYPRNMGFIPGLEGTAERDMDNVKRGLDNNDFRLVVLASAKPDALAAFESVAPRIKVPWIFIDGGDRAEIGGDFERVGGADSFRAFQEICRRTRPSVIFKRELAVGEKTDGVFPLPFSASATHVPALDPQSDKKYQVAFWAVESSETRKNAFQILKGRYDCDRNGTRSGQTFRKYSLREAAYFEALNRTRVSLSFRGEGFDTLRFWEIPLCGSLLLSENPIIQIPDPFTQGKNAVFCKNDLSDLTSLIDHYLANPKEAAQIAVEGQAHVLKYHTHRRRAEYILDILETEL